MRLIYAISSSFMFYIAIEQMIERACGRDSVPGWMIAWTMFLGAWFATGGDGE